MNASSDIARRTAGMATILRALPRQRRIRFLRSDLDQQRVALAAAGADGREAEAAALAAQLVDER